MPLKLNSTGGGSVTVDVPNTASTYTATLPASTGTVVLADGSNNVSVTGNLSFNSGYGSSAVAYGCRAWVNFNGTGTVAIRGSANITSITDNGVGDYTLNFTNAMPDINYSAVGTCQFTLSGDRNTVISAPYNQAPTTTTLRICATGGTTANLIDMLYIYASVFR